MPYFIEHDGTIVVTIGSGKTPDASHEIPREIAEHFKLNHGDKLDSIAADYAAKADWAAFSTNLSGTTNAEAPDIEGVTLPRLGRWEYKVELITELGGFATAQGTVDRMTQAINRLAAEGWQLVISVTRDARYVKGETMMLLFSRFKTTEREFRNRFAAEERIRRSVIAELDHQRKLTSERDTDGQT